MARHTTAERDGLMKVWEMINVIKGTTASADEILNWMVMNKICPLDVGEELEEGDQPELEETAHKHCAPKKTGACGRACYMEFLMLEAALKGEADG